MKKILISGIRDDAFYFEVLEKEGYQVIRVVMTQVIDLLQKYHPCLIILGTCVDSDNGVEVMKEIKKYNKNIKIIMVGNTEALKDELLREGAHQFLIKPVTSEQLLEAVNT